MAEHQGGKAAGSPATREEKEKDTFYCVFWLLLCWRSLPSRPCSIKNKESSGPRVTSPHHMIGLGSCRGSFQKCDFRPADCTTQRTESENLDRAIRHTFWCFRHARESQRA